MPKVIIKQGFLGLGRPIEKWYCDKCGIECQNQFYKKPLMYCRDCANLVDPDIVHMWPSDNIVREYREKDFFVDTKDGQQKLIESCNSCLGLLVVIRTGKHFQRHHYRLGTIHPTASNFPCIEHAGYDERGNVMVQTSCDHDFIVVGTSRHLDNDAHEKYNHIMSHRNPTVEAMYGSDEIDIQYHCFGTTNYWCYKCGLFRSLNPQREHLLPLKGLKRT